MSAHFDDLETRDRGRREADLFGRLPAFLTQASAGAPGLARWLEGVDPAAVTTRQALAKLPVLRKAELAEFQANDPPFGGFANPQALQGTRLFHVAGADLGGAGPGHRPMAGRAGVFRGGNPRRRHRPQRVLLSS